MEVSNSFNWNQPEEITINLPCGVISGKWWGPKDIRPILCLHGWEDNAGTFDRLIPLLPKHVSYLAIDFPGHGLSFRYPSGIPYNFMDFIFIIRLIADLYKWKKVSLLSHSMGIGPSFNYTGLYPEDVDLFISLDGIQPPCETNKRMHAIMKNDIENYVKFEKRIMSNVDQPSFTLEEIERRIYPNAITKEAIPYLLERGLTQSKLDPAKYYFTRDIRVKSGAYRVSNNSFAKYMISRMRMPYLYIKAKDSRYFDVREIHDTTVDEFRKCNPNFQFQLVDGNHHVHLTHPERISGYISETILKARPANSESELVNQNFHISCKL